MKKYVFLKAVVMVCGITRLPSAQKASFLFVLTVVNCMRLIVMVV